MAGLLRGNVGVDLHRGPGAHRGPRAAIRHARDPLPYVAGARRIRCAAIPPGLRARALSCGCEWPGGCRNPGWRFCDYVGRGSGAGQS
ncbi:MAG: hypothetical protein GEU93_08260 [Propionibacteriales bacterium]|nr:hypothetical protein [Propionibacteriales bacterium]